MEDWKSPSEPGQSPRKKKKKRSKKTKNKSEVWSDNTGNSDNPGNKPKREPQSFIHENLNNMNTINISIIEKWQRDNEATGRDDKESYKARIHGHLGYGQFGLSLQSVC